MDSAGADVVGRVVQRRDAPDPATFVGRGKADTETPLAAAIPRNVTGWPVLVSLRIPVSARATAASRLAAAAWRSVAILSCSAGIAVASWLAADRDGDRLPGPGRYSRAADRAAA
ncbi:MAG: hypothetical protein ACLP7J_26740 [Streptosporangiaceae bacterium]